MLKRTTAVPAEIRSPTLTNTVSIVPASEDGTSIVALSLSKVINGSSTLTASPGLTKTSMISTSSKSPISGTITSTEAEATGPEVGAGSVDEVLADGVGASTTSVAACSLVPAACSFRIDVPSATRSPTLTSNSATCPSSGHGTSIVALSLSNVITGSSAFSESPGLTRISMISTSLKSPISGTLISLIVDMYSLSQA